MTAEQFNLDPRATTSVEWQEENKEKRERKGNYYGDRVKRVDGKASPNEEPKAPNKPIQLKPYPTKLPVGNIGPVNGKPK